MLDLRGVLVARERPLLTGLGDSEIAMDLEVGAEEEGLGTNLGVVVIVTVFVAILRGAFLFFRSLNDKGRPSVVEAMLNERMAEINVQKVLRKFIMSTC